MRLVVVSLLVVFIGLDVSMGWVARLKAWQAANVASARLVDRLSERGESWDCDPADLDRLVGDVVVPVALSRLPLTVGAGVPYIHAEVGDPARYGGCVVETAVSVHWGAKILRGWTRQTAVVCRAAGPTVVPVPLSC